MDRVKYWDARPENNWLNLNALAWDRRDAIRAIAASLDKPRVLEIGVDRGDVLSFCHEVFGSYTGVDIKLKKEVEAIKGLSCPFVFIQSNSVDFWKSLGKTDLFDLVFVDGCHSKIGSHLDVTQAMLRLAPGGYILAHDMSEYDAKNDNGPAWSYNRTCNLPGWYSRILDNHGEGMALFFREE